MAPVLAVALASALLVTLTWAGPIQLGRRDHSSPAAGAVHFTAAGDFGSNATSGSVLGAMAGAGGDFALALGDLSYAATGQEQAWCDLVTSKLGAGYPFELLAGNHESNGQNGNINDFSACLPNQLPGLRGTYGRQYFVDYPREAPMVRLVMISPGIPYPDGVWSYAQGTANYNWTASAIDGARSAGIPWVVVGMHKPCLSVGVYGCETGADVMNLLVDKRVDLVLTGHEHLYQRTKQLALGTQCPALTPGSFVSGCVADGGSSLVRGAGTVTVTAGVGGQEFRPIDLADPESAFFSTAMGANVNPTAGYLDVTIDDSALSARFVGVSGGTFTDGFVIRKTAPPQNLPPTARIVVSCTELTCLMDGSTSSDPEGPISSYAWSFGDGAQASGQSTSHTYAAPGVVNITLTVTDAQGASASTSSSVTIQSASTLARDDFNRTIAGGWGSAQIGGAWSTTGGAGTSFVGSGAAALRLAAGGGPTAALRAVTATDVDLSYGLRLDKLPTGSGAYVSAAVRQSATASYRAMTRITATGTTTLSLVRSVSGTDITLASVTPPLGTLAAGDAVSVRLQAVGTNPTVLRAKVWRAGTTEPANWQVSANDSAAALQSPGWVGFITYLSSGATNAPITASFDDVVVLRP